MSAQQQQDEMTERLWDIYRHILLMNKWVAIEDLEPLDEDALSLIRWAFNISKH